MRFSILACLLLAACGGGSETGADAGTPDAEAAPDAGCEPTAALPFAWRPIESVSTGTVSTTPVGGYTEATIDATAGGSMDYPNNPFIYVDLQTGTKVDIDDVEAYSSDTWDLAIKRMVIRMNGGDSGPENVAAAIVFNAPDLASVTASPPDNEFIEDDWADDNCELIAGPLDEPLTVFGNWYEYDVNTHVLTPQPYVYVVRTRDGTKVKLRIDTYYGDPANPMRGAYYVVQWAPL
jgi:hypothetical protein